MSAVDDVLEDRRRLGRARSRTGLVASAVLHVTVIVGGVLAPRLGAQRPRPIEYVAVTILPVQALGAPARPAPPPEPKKEPVREPEPEPPAKVDPEIPKVPEPEAAKTPTKKPKDKVREEPKPTPGPPAPDATEPRADPSADARRVGSAEGVASGQSAFGTTAVATLDNPDFTYGYYIDQMLRLIRERWVRPPLGSGVQAALHFVIHQDGRVSDVEIRESSGYNSFDAAAQRAILSSSPLPPLPRGYRRSTLGVTLVVR